MTYSMGKITQSGKQKLEMELQHLEDVERPALAKRLKTAISYGDLSENAEYAEAKYDQAKLEQRISEIKSLLRSSDIASPLQGGIIQVGTYFEVSTDSTLRLFSMVGKAEANPLEGKISSDSPLGAAFLNKKEGDTVKVTTPGGTKIYKIEKII